MNLLLHIQADSPFYMVHWIATVAVCVRFGLGSRSSTIQSTTTTREEYSLIQVLISYAFGYSLLLETDDLKIQEVSHVSIPPSVQCWLTKIYCRCLRRRVTAV